MRKKTEWTNEMDKFLVKTGVTLQEFYNKYGITKSVACKRRQELLAKLGTEEDEVEVIMNAGDELKELMKEDTIKEVEEVANSTILKIIPSVLLDVDSLIEKGSKFYITEVRNNISNSDKALEDCVHALESHYDSMSDVEKLELTNNIGLLRRQRRVYKNEYEFLDINKFECESFIKFVKELKKYSEKVCNDIYKPRVLKQQLGKRIIVSENNAELKALKDKVRELEAKTRETSDDSTIAYLMKLEKYRVKQTRAEKRLKGVVVPVDELVLHWRDEFNGKLDAETKKAILSDCYGIYRQDEDRPKFKEVEDYIVWNEILPHQLMTKNYFLRKDVK